MPTNVHCGQRRYSGVAVAVGHARAIPKCVDIVRTVMYVAQNRKTLIVNAVAIVDVFVIIVGLFRAKMGIEGVTVCACGVPRGTCVGKIYGTCVVCSFLHIVGSDAQTASRFAQAIRACCVVVGSHWFDTAVRCVGSSDDIGLMEFIVFGQHLPCFGVNVNQAAAQWFMGIDIEFPRQTYPLSIPVFCELDEDFFAFWEISCRIIARFCFQMRFFVCQIPFIF